MKKILFLAFLTICTVTIYAQFPGAGGKGQSAPNMGHIYGKIVDSAGKPIPDVSVILLQNRMDTVTKKKKDYLLKGLTTKANGEFSLEDLPMFGSLKLKISALGYKPFEQTVSFQMKMPTSGGAPQSSDPAQAMNQIGNMINGFDRDLGNIKLSIDSKQLESVTVTGTKPTLRMDIDKKVYNVEKDIVAAGGTALDVMKNVPSVQVDIDGNVKLRNTTPTIYIEGRPTTLSLDQIPADAIESVEVITNPSAKYDASGGGAGILNIILKKNRKTGYNGNLRAGVDKNGGVNGGGDFNVRQGKINFSAAGMANLMNGKTTGTTDREDFLGTPSIFTHQQNNDRNKGGFMFGRVGLDYFMSNRTTLSIAGVKVHGEFKPKSIQDKTISIDSLNGAKYSAFSEQNSNSTRTFNATGLQLGFKHLFPREGETLTGDFNMFSGKNSGNSMYNTNYYDNGPGSNVAGQYLQKQISDGTNRFLTVQTDYVRPFTGKTKLETGLRFSQQKLMNNNSNYIFQDSVHDYVVVPTAITNYKNTNNVYAAYVSFTSNIKDFGYQVGLRGERSNYTGELINTKENFSNSYPISLFPSVFLSQKLKNKQELQISYTRKINRPNFFQLIPYTDYTDSLNITRGNPNLVPEFTSSFEFSYLKTFAGNNTFLASAYYKHTTNLITRFTDTAQNPVSSKTDFINTFENANSSYTVGAEFTAQNTLNKWWDISTNINIYNSHINTNNLTGTSQDALWSWFGKFNSNFKLPKKFKIQLTATYQSRTNLPVSSGGGGMMGPPGSQAQSSSQGFIRAFYSTDIAMSKSFLKNDAATVSLSFSDIFRSRKQDQFSQGIGFNQEFTRLRDPQMVRLNLTYRFGKMDVSLFKRKNMSQGGTGDAMQGAQQ